MAGAFSSWMALLQRSTAPPPDPDAGKGELEALDRLWRRIQAHLKDLEDREVLDESERLDLGELQDIALDADDVLDAWEYEWLRARVEEGGAHKRARGGEGIDRAYRLLADRAGKITERFHSANDPFGVLHSKKGEGERRPWPGVRAPSSSLVDERHVYGRDDDKQVLVYYMLSDDCARSDQLCVIPIMGMGLVGKTTLAQLIYNDPDVVNAFSLRVWVSLTSNDDLKMVLRSVVECLTRQPCRLDQFDTIQCLLRQSLNGNKFLIVLDDVYCEHLSFWDQLKLSLLSGSNGSVILLTTKMGEVADTTKTVPAAFYMFDRSPDDSCWLTFKRYAFDGQDSVEQVDMEGLRRKVADICDGMPSVAKLLGASFRSRFDTETWMDFMEDAVEREILPALQSNYQLLPSHLKPCVLYCSLLPKGYLFKKAQLIRLWTAQGIILPKNQKCPEDIGIQYFNELISRSFFLQSETDEQAYFMPSIICDLVYSISRNEYSRVVDVAQSSPEISPFISGPQRMSIDLSYTNIHILPDTIGNLRHLHFLALNHTLIKTLPESMHKLYNLQTLELKWCPWLQELPRGITSLINLRHLDLEDSYYLLMPLQIRNLTGLQKLPTFNLKKGNEFCGMRELQDLENLRELGISGLCNVTNLDDAKKANMQKKRDLKILKLIWPSNDVSPISEKCGDHVDQNRLNTVDETDEEEEKYDYDHKDARDSFDEQCGHHEITSSCDVDGEPVRKIQDEQESNVSSIRLRAGISNMGIQDCASSNAAVSEEDLLESLHPSTTLEKLCIQSYGGERFPDWIGHASFFKLMCVELTDCKCVVLPCLGQLPYLKFLRIDGMPVELVGAEFCGTRKLEAFPNLETLSFHNMNKWKIWDGVKKGDFPKLNKLCLFNCPEMRGVPGFFSSLKILEVERCTKLTDIPELQSLIALHIHYCDALASLPTLVSLCSLTIMYCQKLKFLPLFPELEKLWIENCEQLTSVVFCCCCPLSAGLPFRIVDLNRVLVANCSQLCFSSKEPLVHIPYSVIDGCLSLSWNKTQGIENCEQLTSIVFCCCCRLLAGLPCRIADLNRVLVANCSQLCFSSKEPLVHIPYSVIDGCLSLSWNKTQGSDD